MSFVSIAQNSSVVAPPHPLHLDADTFRVLFAGLGPSLGLWRGAEIAALRECEFVHPILDLGCGDGLITSLFLSKVEIGLDPNRNELGKASKAGIYNRLVPFAAEDAPIANESLATVVSNSVLEHLPHLDAVLQMVARVLKPGGRLITTSPTEAFGAWLALPSKRYAAQRNRALGHLNLWSVERWAEHLQHAGLEIEQVRPYLRRTWVSLWDTLELAQQVWIARRRVFGMLWRKIPRAGLDYLARWASRLDLSAPVPGGGRLIVARKVQT